MGDRVQGKERESESQRVLECVTRATDRSHGGERVEGFVVVDKRAGWGAGSP